MYGTKLRVIQRLISTCSVYSHRLITTSWSFSLVSFSKTFVIWSDIIQVESMSNMKALFSVEQNRLAVCHQCEKGSNRMVYSCHSSQWLNIDSILFYNLSPFSCVNRLAKEIKLFLTTIFPVFLNSLCWSFLWST